MNCRFLGIVLADRDDLVGSAIGGEKVVCRKEELYDYIQTKMGGWNSDQMSVNNIIYQDSFVTQCTQMGVTVHIKISEIGEDAGKSGTGEDCGICGGVHGHRFIQSGSAVCEAAD